MNLMRDFCVGNAAVVAATVGAVVGIGAVRLDAHPAWVGFQEEANRVRGAFNSAGDTRPELEHPVGGINERILVVLPGDFGDIQFSSSPREPVSYPDRSDLFPSVFRAGAWPSRRAVSRPGTYR